MEKSIEDYLNDLDELVLLNTRDDVKYQYIRGVVGKLLAEVLQGAQDGNS